MSRRRPSNPRRGVSLAELLILLSITTVLIGLSAKLIHRVMQIHSKGIAFQRGEQSAWRLASQIRRDAHAADAVAIDDEQDQEILRLNQADQRQVEYRVVGRSVIRTFKQGEKTVAREEFNFPSNLVLHVDQGVSPERVVFVLESIPHTVPGPNQQPLRSVERVPFAMRVEACLAQSSGSLKTRSTKVGAP